MKLIKLNQTRNDLRLIESNGIKLHWTEIELSDTRLTEFP